VTLHLTAQSRLYHRGSQRDAIAAKPILHIGENLRRNPRCTTLTESSCFSRSIAPLTRPPLLLSSGSGSVVHEERRAAVAPETLTTVRRLASNAVTSAARGDSRQSVLDAVSSLAVHAISGAEYASVTVTRGQTPTTAAATDDIAREFDLLQYVSGEGPCLEAIARRDVVKSANVKSEHRWPGFTARATSTPIRSALSVPLLVGDELLGSVNVTSRETKAFADDSNPLPTFVALHAATVLLLLDAREREQDVTQALTRFSRDVANPMRSALMVISNAISVLGTRRDAIDPRLREVVDLLVTELQWHEALSRELLKLPMALVPPRPGVARR
jgi:hypothetical protein